MRGCKISRPAGRGGLRLRNPTPSLYADARSPATRVAPQIEGTPPSARRHPGRVVSAPKGPIPRLWICTRAHKLVDNWWTHRSRACYRLGAKLGFSRTFLQGERGDSNPRPPGPQPSGRCTEYPGGSRWHGPLPQAAVPYATRAGPTQGARRGRRGAAPGHPRPPKDESVQQTRRNGRSRKSCRGSTQRAPRSSRTPLPQNWYLVGTSRPNQPFL